MEPTEHFIMDCYGLSRVREESEMGEFQLIYGIK